MVIFEAASALADEEARRILLDVTCHDNPRRRKLLEALLAEKHEADEFFQFRPGQSGKLSDARGPSSDETLSTRIGRYRLIDRIGAGGYGAVYLAEQLEPISRKVALKIIRLGLDTEKMIARFTMERQALAVTGSGDFVWDWDVPRCPRKSPRGT